MYGQNIQGANYRKGSFAHNSLVSVTTFDEHCEDSTAKTFPVVSSTLEKTQDI
ncbi:MAG: hypothetical protein SAK29_17345 [Scytonema sp. PMC 1069.18]|nr:hypothetical protein [Scytonema sp. PMC 1069.18]MEC4882196.1 hypothetical protein [Scytonema sp. PMC 1070.18]